MQINRYHKNLNCRQNINALLMGKKKLHKVLFIENCDFGNLILIFFSYSQFAFFIKVPIFKDVINIVFYKHCSSHKHGLLSN